LTTAKSFDILTIRFYIIILIVQTILFSDLYLAKFLLQQNHVDDGTRHAETGCGLSKVSTVRVDQSGDGNDESIDDDATMMMAITTFSLFAASRTTAINT